MMSTSLLIKNNFYYVNDSWWEIINRITNKNTVFVSSCLKYWGYDRNRCKTAEKVTNIQQSEVTCLSPHKPGPSLEGKRDGRKRKALQPGGCRVTDKGTDSRWRWRAGLALWAFTGEGVSAPAHQHRRNLCRSPNRVQAQVPSRGSQQFLTVSGLVPEQFLLWERGAELTSLGQRGGEEPPRVSMQQAGQQVMQWEGTVISVPSSNTPPS